MKTRTCGLVLGWLAWTLPSMAMEIVIPTFHDGEIHRAGTQSTTVDAVSATVQTSKSGGNVHSGAFLFDLSVVPENYTVNSAAFDVTLSLQISNTDPTALVEFHGFASDTTIQPIDFDSPVSNVGSLLAVENFDAGVGNNPEGTQLSIDLDASKIQSRIDGNGDMLMLRTETVNFVTFQVHSRDNTEAIRAPSLVLNAVADADFNADDVLDCLDVDSLVAAIASGGNQALFDLTGDGAVDNSDLDEWLSQAGAVNLASGNAYLRGDANLDGSVDVTDFNIWNANKFTSTARWCAGDFDADGAVDVSDFNAWNVNKFTLADSVSAVPEPSCGLLALIGLLGVFNLRRSGR